MNINQHRPKELRKESEKVRIEYKRKGLRCRLQIKKLKYQFNPTNELKEEIEQLTEEINYLKVK